MPRGSLRVFLNLLLLPIATFAAAQAPPSQPQPQPASAQIQLGEGDRLLVLSDGIVEATDADGKAWAP